MPQQKILTYDEVLKQTTKEHRVLLLGNGFSRAYDDKRFSYTSLLDSAIKSGIIKKHSPIHKAFLRFSTSDFEQIIKALEDANKVVTAYNYKQIEKIKEDSKLLKNYLVQVVTNNHPDKSTDVKDSKYLSAIDFIKEYSRIYTINYDLLLYWTTMKYLELTSNGKIPKSINIADGFANGEDEEDYVEFLGEPEILYLHGALHIFDKGHAIVKKTFSRTGIPLKKQTLESLEQNIYPLFISEGTSEQKLTKIMHNAYLNVCFRRLEKMSANKSLIIFGTKLVSGDAHIVSAIMRSHCKTIYFPVSSEKQISEPPAQDFLEKAKELSGRKVYFYDYNTVNVWNKYDNTTK